MEQREGYTIVVIGNEDRGGTHHGNLSLSYLKY